ncbi:hypothetical protein D3C76_820930 [compost metagenome]
MALRQLHDRVLWVWIEDAGLPGAKHPGPGITRIIDQHVEESAIIAVYPFCQDHPAVFVVQVEPLRLQMIDIQVCARLLLQYIGLRISPGAPVERKHCHRQRDRNGQQQDSPIDAQRACTRGRYRNDFGVMAQASNRQGHRGI